MIEREISAVRRIEQYHAVMPRPVIVSTWSFAKRGNDAAWIALRDGGTSLDAVEKVCKEVEIDSNVDSVGFGGLPDSSGRVSLDGCVMQGPDRCGSVCHIRRFLHPVSIARAVMEKTNHVMLAGDGAELFASELGFIEADLLSAEAQDKYEKWKRENAQHGRSEYTSYSIPRPIDRADGGRLYYHPASQTPVEAGTPPHELPHDTVSVLALDSAGSLAGACSTSGLPFKMPGRVGDSPIVGHGLYVEPNVGAAGATGTGELITGICGSFLAVELMRQGAKPLDALREVLQRVIDTYQLRNEDQVALVALTPNGEYASAALRDGYKTSVAHKDESFILEPDFVMIS